jgi:hypothetical protein
MGSLHHPQGARPDQAIGAERALSAGVSLFLQMAGPLLHHGVGAVHSGVYTASPLYSFFFCLSCLSQAKRILDDDMACDIIKIGGLVRNKVSTTPFSHHGLKPICIICSLACGLHPAFQNRSASSSGGSVLLGPMAPPSRSVPGCSQLRACLHPRRFNASPRPRFSPHRRLSC